MRSKDLLETALRIRAKLESVPFSGELNRCSVLKGFPKDCCQVAALFFLYYLKKRRLVNSKELFLLANAEIVKGSSHAWAWVDGYHVDLTADQFCADKVKVTQDDPWPGIFKGPDRYPFDKEWLMPEYKEDLLKLYDFIDA